MPPHRKTIKFFKSMVPSEELLDGGPARCPALDGVSVGRADWVATDQALYYFWYRAGKGNRWAWDAIAAIDFSPGGGLLPGEYQVTIKFANGEALSIWMGQRAAASLRTIGLAMWESQGEEETFVQSVSEMVKDVPLSRFPPVLDVPRNQYLHFAPLPPRLSSSVSCPSCHGELVLLDNGGEESGLAADCAECRLVWCDPLLSPITVPDGPDEGRLVGTKPMALYDFHIESGAHERINAFMRRPRPDGTAFPFP